MTYSKKRITQTYKYYLNDTELTRVSHINDLDVYFDPSLSFNDHYAHIIIKSSSMLGFISRICSDFNNPKALKSLYCSFVRPILKYNSVVWSPYKSGPTDYIEAVQNRFLSFLAFKSGVHCQRHTSYSPLLTLTNLETLGLRRIRLDLCFTFKLLNDIINCSELLVKFNFLVPTSCTRNSYTFYVPFHCTNYAKNAPITRLMPY
jgi:hypothetical protein